MAISFLWFLMGIFLKQGSKVACLTISKSCLSPFHSFHAFSCTTPPHIPSQFIKMITGNENSREFQAARGLTIFYWAVLLHAKLCPSPVSFACFCFPCAKVVKMFLYECIRTMLWRLPMSWHTLTLSLMQCLLNILTLWLLSWLLETCNSSTSLLLDSYLHVDSSEHLLKILTWISSLNPAFQ